MFAEFAITAAMAGLAVWLLADLTGRRRRRRQLNRRIRLLRARGEL